MSIEVANLWHRYGARVAVRDLSVRIASGELFAILGPNGSGKTTLFRVLATLIPLQAGAVRVAGRSLPAEQHEVRRRIGVVFQSPSLDRQLTVAENLAQQAALYGMAGAAFRRRRDALLETFGLADRAGERTARLSGGLRRRVELAKGLLHEPQVLLLDEPSTGLDPAARSDLGRCLRQLRERSGVTVVLTTHLLDEAERVDRLAILDRGELVALDTPEALRATVGGDAITIRADEPETLAEQIRQRWALPARAIDGSVRMEVADGHGWIGPIVDAFGQQLRSITLGKPSLEDVFIARTGHRFPGEVEDRHGG